MPKRRRADLVIDACIARSAGDTYSDIATLCRETLQAVLEHRHRTVFAKELAAEWDKHASRFAQRWLAIMASRGLILQPRVVQNADLRACLRRNLRDPDKRAALKDAHLLEAA